MHDLILIMNQTRKTANVYKLYFPHIDCITSKITRLSTWEYSECSRHVITARQSLDVSFVFKPLSVLNIIMCNHLILTTIHVVLFYYNTT